MQPLLQLTTGGVPEVAVDFSLFFFGQDSAHCDGYGYLFDATAFADANGFRAVWLPERHFLRFGGLYGSPSVIGASVAARTTRIGIRAGSIVLPLGDPLRIAEEWSIVDNISNGRVGIAAASGWHADDFVLSPMTYKERKAHMLSRLELVRRLWRGETVILPNGVGSSTAVRIRPRPIQSELPVWLTAASIGTAELAARMGLNLLTANFSYGLRLVELRKAIRAYRDRIKQSHDRYGHVTLMVHTYVGHPSQSIDGVVRPALKGFLEANIEMQVAQAKSIGRGNSYSDLGGKQKAILIDMATAAYCHGELSLIGTIDECLHKAELLEDSGVDELACLVDFGLRGDQIVEGLARMLPLLVRARQPKDKGR